MRRKEREIANPARIREILRTCKYCRLGLSDGKSAYVVPLNFGFTEENGTYTFYFHGAGEGRKLDLIEKNHYAGFEMDTGFALLEGDTACSYSAQYQSIIGEGPVEILEDIQEKRRALLEIMKHQTGKADWEFPEPMIRATCVFRLRAEQLSCKEHMQNR